MMIVVTMHATARVSARVDATQQRPARHDPGHRPAALGLHRAEDRRRSSKESTGTSLRFIHADRLGAVSPTPTLSKISLSGDTLTQYDYAW